jgi:CheY-like chemotaxis protein
MLLCQNQSECDSAAVESLSEGLKAGHLCVYASVLNGKKSHIDQISSRIENYSERIEKGDLVIIDFYPFYQSALAGDLGPFDGLKGRIEQMLSKRTMDGRGDKVLIFAEAAGALSEHHEFERSVNLEKWWNDVHLEWIRKRLNITVICPHPSDVLNSKHLAKSHLADVHSVTLELDKIRKKHMHEIRVLAVEPEKDIQSVYQMFFKKSGINATVTGDSVEAIELLKSSAVYDLIMIDQHIRDMSIKDLTRMILAIKPEQRIILTTTLPHSEIKSQLDEAGVREMLVKPFSTSSLLSLVRPNGSPRRVFDE